MKKIIVIIVCLFCLTVLLIGARSRFEMQDAVQLLEIYLSAIVQQDEKTALNCVLTIDLAMDIIDDESFEGYPIYFEYHLPTSESDFLLTLGNDDYISYKIKEGKKITNGFIITTQLVTTEGEHTSNFMIRAIGEKLLIDLEGTVRHPDDNKIESFEMDAK